MGYTETEEISADGRNLSAWRKVRLSKLWFYLHSHEMLTPLTNATWWTALCLVAKGNGTTLHPPPAQLHPHAHPATTSLVFCPEIYLWLDIWRLETD